MVSSPRPHWLTGRRVTVTYRFPSEPVPRAVARVLVVDARRSVYDAASRAIARDAGLHDAAAAADPTRALLEAIDAESNRSSAAACEVRAAIASVAIRPPAYARVRAEDRARAHRPESERPVRTPPPPAKRARRTSGA